MPITLDREAWLNESAQFIWDGIIAPTLPTDFPIPPYRVSVGFPTNRGRARKMIGACYVRAASTDGTNEIFIAPTIDDSGLVLATLTHELIHASDDCQSGHRNHFARVARAVGLEGHLTATHAGEALAAKLTEIIEILGPIPHARLDLREVPKQGTRQLKIWCDSCGFTFRTSAKWIHTLHPDLSQCPACRETKLNIPSV